jgi:hypothetical protein
MSVDPFWKPIQYSKLRSAHYLLCFVLNTINPVPIVGMLSGNAISGIILSVNFVLKELQ